MTWDKLEEVRTYGGATHEEAATNCQAGMGEALREGYLADRVEWATDGLEVTVEYAYDPSRAGGSV